MTGSDAGAPSGDRSGALEGSRAPGARGRWTIVAGALAGALSVGAVALLLGGQRHARPASVATPPPAAPAADAPGASTTVTVSALPLVAPAVSAKPPSSAASPTPPVRHLPPGWSSPPPSPRPAPSGAAVVPTSRPAPAATGRDYGF